MEAEFLSRKQLINTNKKLIKSLSRRIANIYKNGLEVGNEAVDNYRRLVDETENFSNLTKMTDRKLRNLYRDLKYIDTLKGSTVIGAKHNQKVWQPVKEKLSSLSKTLQDKFWGIYSRVASQLPDIVRYKYEVMQVSIDETALSSDESDMAIEILNLYDEANYEVGNVKNRQNTVDRLFLRKLQQFFKIN